MIRAARYLVVAQTLFFFGLAVVALANPSDVSPTAAYAVIGMQFAGLCVIASWRTKWRRK
jgi:O-antigen/teichoic acid export membrane protein